MADPYEAVRFIAYRSLRKQPPYRDLQYEFLGPDDQRYATAVDVIERWAGSNVGPNRRTGEAILIGPDGTIRASAVTRLHARRDDRVVVLAE